MGDIMSDLDMMLPFPVTIKSFSHKRNIENLTVMFIDRCYTVTLQFQNTTIETDIYEGDPRYQLIKDHLKSTGRELE